MLPCYKIRTYITFESKLYPNEYFVEKVLFRRLFIFNIQIMNRYDQFDLSVSKTGWLTRVFSALPDFL